MMKELKEMDARFAEPELLEYDIICYKCNKKPKNCTCDDKWFRLRSFKVKLISARFHVGCGGASSRDHKLVDKFGI